MHTARTPFEIGDAVWRVVSDEEGARDDFRERLRAVGRMLSGGLSASETSINQPIGPYRRLDWLRMDLDRVRAVRRCLGGSLNDVVLATVAGAMRKFLGDGRGEPVDHLHFRVLAPVSLRGQSDRGQLGNQVAAWIVQLPIDEADAASRLARVREVTEELKASHQALAAEALTQVNEWMGSGLMQLAAGLTAGAPPFNMVVTNVPGPQLPLYLLESRMLEAHPMVPLFPGLTTGIALFSYDGLLCWGFSGDWDRTPDLHDLVIAVEESFAELEHAAGL
jgi:WS/DGAT/MGAT family acyltransferase